MYLRGLYINVSLLRYHWTLLESPPKTQNNNNNNNNSNNKIICSYKMHMILGKCLMKFGFSRPDLGYTWSSMLYTIVQYIE